MPVKVYKIYPPLIISSGTGNGYTYDKKGADTREMRASVDGTESVRVDADQGQLDIMEANGYGN